MIHRALVLAALGCCALLLISFSLFARDQLAAGSKHQQNELAGGSPSSAQIPAAHKVAQPRRFIDSAASTLTSPFNSIVESSSEWVTRGIPTLLGLVAYGLGLGYLARFSRGFA